MADSISNPGIPSISINLSPDSAEAPLKSSHGNLSLKKLNAFQSRRKSIQKEALENIKALVTGGHWDDLPSPMTGRRISISPEEIEKQVRMLRVVNLRHDRQLIHLEHFIRIKAKISNSVTLSLIVDKRNTIEYLAHQIEADFAYRFLIPVENAEEISPAEDIQPLVCGAIYDSSQRLLRFTEYIQNVLDMDSTLTVVNVYDQTGPLSFTPLRDSTSMYSKSDYNFFDQDSNYYPSDEEQLRSIFSNAYALNVFHEFCVSNYQIENFLFLMSVDILESCPADYKEIMSKYIYQTFIIHSAPLMINLSEDIRKDIPAPSGVLELLAYDEARDHVYSTFKAHVLHQFTTSSKFQNLSKMKTKRPEEYKKHDIQESLFHHLNPPSRMITEITKWSSKETNGSDTAELDRKHRVLGAAIRMFFPNSQYAVISDYFTERDNLPSIQRRRKIQKEKKIAKFFGERPLAEDIQRQLLVSSGLEFISNELSNKNLKDLTSNLSKEYSTIEESFGEDDEDRVAQMMRKKKNEKLHEFFGGIIPKPELLAQNIPAESAPNTSALVVKGGGANISSISVYVPPTRNDIEPVEKKTLAKRHRKIENMFGEKIDEHLAFKVLTNPHLRRKSEAENVKLNKKPIGEKLLPEKSVDVVTKKAGSQADGFEGSKSGYDEALKIRTINSEESTEQLTSFPKIERRTSSTQIVAPRLVKSSSLSSLDSQSSVSYTKNERKLLRRKLNKLTNFLGERITDSDISFCKSNDGMDTHVLPLSPEQLYLKNKRLNKLEKVFGNNEIGKVMIGDEAQKTSSLKMVDNKAEKVKKKKVKEATY